MSTLDQPQFVDEKTVSYWPVVQRYGLIGGLVLIAFALVSFLFGLNDPTNANVFLGLITFAVSAILYIAIGGWAARSHRDQDLGGYISFGRAFRVAFLALLIAMVIGALFQLLYTTLIEPDFFDNLVDNIVAMYEEQGMSEEQIDMALSFTRFFYTPVGFLIAGLGSALFFSALFGVISAAIFKRTIPKAA